MYSIVNQFKYLESIIMDPKNIRIDWQNQSWSGKLLFLSPVQLIDIKTFCGKKSDSKEQMMSSKRCTIELKLFLTKP